MQLFFVHLLIAQCYGNALLLGSFSCSSYQNTFMYISAAPGAAILIFMYLSFQHSYTYFILFIGEFYFFFFFISGGLFKVRNILRIFIAMFDYWTGT